MKFKMVIIVVLIWFGQNAFGQANTEKNNTVEDTPHNTIVVTNENSEVVYNDKEWKKIKRQIRRNKKRITNSKNGIHSYKKVDTIFLEIKISKTNSQITNW
ncbi:hypothetical protein J8L88_09470 [Aquimarina sp. MMG015]|uniref:hypothetical protein n=1 Tax=Aquimarina TaxID=290174 RepID=UPI0004097109|nr:MULTISPECIES: hypothetical protein [Aquimarina]AXT58026.1 hypothetical protein D1815_20535 [Aquimarina sp. AD1]MBQ4803075.1 hypothetical protein [Aquimarina sp. MMG015]RKN10422.1 hypothetical protein D7035_19460 [Aquimarina sp. AD1]